MVICQGSTRSELPSGLLALCRRTLGSERHRYAIAWPDKLGTDPMAYGGFIMDAAAELGKNPVSKHQIQPEYGDEQADAGRDGWTRLARPNSQARTGTGECSFSLISWPRAGLATLPGWSILCYMWWPYIHTYIHTQEEGHTEFLIDLSAVRALIFLARRIQPFLSLVDREVEFLCTNDLIVLHPLGIFI